MNEAKQRVREELDELIIKLNKLITFMSTDKFISLTSEMRFAMSEQRDLMIRYADCLTRRLAIWDKTEEDFGYSLGHSVK